jgi:hypothetical protein
MQAWLTTLPSGRNNDEPLLPEGMDFMVPLSKVVRMTLPLPATATIEVSSYGVVDLLVPPSVFMKFAGLMRPVGRLSKVAETRTRGSAVEVAWATPAAVVTASIALRARVIRRAVERMADESLSWGESAQDFRDRRKQER